MTVALTEHRTGQVRWAVEQREQRLFRNLYLIDSLTNWLIDLLVFICNEMPQYKAVKYIQYNYNYKFEKIITYEIVSHVGKLPNWENKGRSVLEKTILVLS